MTHTPLGTARFSILATSRDEALRVPAPRHGFVMAFLSVWLAGWTAGGVAAITSFLATDQPFLLFWLSGWALDWASAALALAWMFFGSETLRVIDGDVEVVQTMLGISRRHLYRGTDLHGVAPAPPPPRRLAPLPFGIGGQQGAIQFTCAGRSRTISPRMDLAKAGAIIAWLRQRLPASA